MRTLDNATVFLSAAFPNYPKGEQTHPYDPFAISNAVSAFCRAVLRREGRLLMRPQPSITSMVSMIAHEFDVEEPIVDFDPAWHQLVQDLSTDRDSFMPSDLPESDRSAPSPPVRCDVMQKSLPNYHGPIPKVAIFIGGREEIKDEFHILKAVWPEVPFIPVAGPGGAAAELPFDDYVKLGLQGLEGEVAYPFLTGEVMDAVADESTQTGSKVRTPFADLGS